MNLSIAPLLLQALAFKALLLSGCISSTSAMRMNNMLMSQDLNSFLSELVTFGDLTAKQKMIMLNMVDDKDGYRTDVFSTPESKDALRSYLMSEVSSGSMDMEAAEAIGSTLSLGALYPSTAAAVATAAMTTNGPVQAVYDANTQGNMVRLGNSNIFRSTSSQSGYNGIWGYATGKRRFGTQLMIYL